MSAIFIHKYLTQRRRLARKFPSPSHAKAESKLLLNQLLKNLSSTIDKTGDDDFPQRYYGIINLPRNCAPVSTQLDLLHRVACSHSLILRQTGKRDDLLWKSGEPDLTGAQLSFWPQPVNAANLVVPPNKRRYRRTRDDVAFWRNVAVMVPQSNVPALVRLLRKGRSAVKAIIAVEDGVCVIFKTETQDYPAWQHWCKVLKMYLNDAGIHVPEISLSTLVPTSNESRGVGSILFLE